MLHSVLYNSQRGIALIMVLLFLQIVTVLGLYSLSTSLLSQKINSESWQRESTILILDELLHAIAVKLQSEIPRCVIAKNNSLNALAKSMDWWRSPITCAGHLQQLQYYYVVEQLGEDSCAQLENIDMSKFAAHYFRITLLAVVKKMSMKILLQSTVIKPFNRIAQCSRESYIVSIGQQTWREL